MNVFRRALRATWPGLLFALLWAGFFNVVAAQDWAPKPLHIIVAFGAGSADTAARLLAEGLRQHFGLTAIVENHPGAGQNVGAALLSRAKPDGATIMVTAPGPLVINEFLYSKLEFDPRSFVPITLLTTDPLVFAVNSKSPYKTLKDFIDAAKQQPGRFTYASAGAGATSHMMSAALFRMAGVEVTHIPYKGGAEAAYALIAGQVDFLASSPVSAVPQIQSGVFRPLAVSAKSGAAILPGIAPAAIAGVPGYDYATWLAVVGPPQLPAGVATAIANAVETVFKEQKLRDTLSTYGSQYEGGGQKRLADWIRDERVRWKAAVEASGATAQ